MDQKLWVFEVFRRSLGKVGMCWSQPTSVDHMRKKWKARRKEISKKKVQARQGQVLTRGRPPTVGRHLALSNLLSFSCFFFFYNFFLESLENGPGLLGEWVYSTPIFGSLPLHLEVLNVPFRMEIGGFIFFQKKNS
jgi:hypothetical protein